MAGKGCETDGCGFNIMGVVLVDGCGFVGGGGGGGGDARGGGSCDVMGWVYCGLLAPKLRGKVLKMRSSCPTDPLICRSKSMTK
jgi:hypothetical protein